MVAHTIIVGASPTEKITGRKADVFLAAYHASQAALRLLKPKADVSSVYLILSSILAFLVYLILLIRIFRLTPSLILFKKYAKSTIVNQSKECLVIN